MDKLDAIIQEKQAELQALQANLNDALTGIDSPDYRRAAQIQPAIYVVQREIDRLEELRGVQPVSQDFSTNFSRLLTNDAVTMMELWCQNRGDEGYMTSRIMEIRKLKNYSVSCRLDFNGPAERYVNSIYTIRELQHLGWITGRSGKTFWLRARVKNPDEFDTFCQRMAATMIEALGGLSKRGPQYYRYR